VRQFHAAAAVALPKFWPPVHGRSDSGKRKWLIKGALSLAGVWRSGCIRLSVAIDALTNQIEHYMDLLSARQKLVASNIANIDTPGYKAKDIDFQFEFLSLAPGQSPHVIDTPGLVVKSDGNSVNLDREARLLAENALRFNVAATLMKAQLKTVESAIKEGQSG